MRSTKKRQSPSGDASAYFSSPWERRLGAVVLVFLLLGSLLVISGDSLMRWEGVERLSRQYFSDVPPGSMPVSPGAFERRIVLPFSSMDARWWVLHTEEAIRDGSLRVRSTSLDNAPLGREVHWSSLLVWVLDALAHVLGWESGRPAASCVAEAALYAGPLLLAAAILLLGGLAAKRFGLSAAGWFILVWITSVPLYLTFQAGEADHHGIVLTFLAGQSLCLLAGVAPDRYSRTLPFEVARHWFRLAGILGGMALWVSAATALPAILGCGMGALARAFLVKGEQRQYSRLWLVWSGWGAFTGVFFYLVEYFPDHLGWRLEVNHPLYSLAWLGGGYVLQYASGVLRGESVLPRGRRLVLLCLAFCAVLLPALLILFRPGDTFWVADRFLLALHREYIQEIRSLWVTVRNSTSSLALLNYLAWPVFAVVSLVWLWRRRELSGAIRGALVLTVLPALVLQGLTFMQVRWASASLGLWAVVILAVVVASRCRTAAPVIVRWGLPLVAAVSILLALFPQFALSVTRSQMDFKAKFNPEDGSGLLVRDIALRLVQSSPTSLPVVLSGPNSSTDLSYSAGIKTIGTLYWENMPGLKRAARIFSATDGEDARRQLVESGVTHIVLPAWDNFAEAYARLLRESGDAAGDVDIPFFRAIVEGRECPQWLRPLCYPIPTASGVDTRSVKIFAVMPDQNRFDSFFYRGVYHAEAGEYARAAAMFDLALAENPAHEDARRFRDWARSRAQ
ncbi:MAG: hypothetical protein J0I10_10345 [Verrucomicrobia bacterium]|nr:hypothetical protein [Verrucomicrobiota bacterium]